MKKLAKKANFEAISSPKMMCNCICLMGGLHDSRDRMYTQRY
ncbi:hypothetical protein PV797_11510 [Clostridiaceae bacterium M8S5]|nr:hypothetical protein PV797_11510 [Clostridiaceae bacterium M8S5]